MTVMRKMLLLCAFVAVMEQTTYEAEAHPWRYIFPFFPEELDILLGHLGTTVLRLEDVLETCKEMSDDDFEADDDDDDNNNNVDINNNSVASIGVQSLSVGPKPSPNLSVEKKVEWIHDLREKVKKLEDDIEECRYKFWTGVVTSGVVTSGGVTSSLCRKLEALQRVRELDKVWDELYRTFLAIQ